MLTETDLMAMCLGEALVDQPSSFGGDQAKKATGIATAALQTGKVDGETFGRVIARLGNHSALRQWAIAHGFLRQPDDALTIAVKAYIAKRNSEDVNAIEESL